MALSDTLQKEAKQNVNTTVIKDGKRVQITCYMINGNNFVKLRDVMNLFDIGVDYNGDIIIDVSKSYED